MKTEDEFSSPLPHTKKEHLLPSPGPPSQLSGLEDAERLALHTEHGCIVLTRQEPTAREQLEAIRLLHDLNVGMVVRLALDSRSASGMPCKKERPRYSEPMTRSSWICWSIAAWICSGWAPC